MSMSWLPVVAAYLLGSLSFAVVVSRLYDLPDPRGFGSGNPGATNVLRSGSKGAAALTLLLDAAKGWLPVYLVWRWGPALGWGPVTLAFTGVAAFAGHLWPVFFGFKGGKGVATAGGVLLGFAPWLGLATIVTWVIIAAFMRYSSLAALVAAVFAPFYYVLGGDIAWDMEPAILAALILISLLLLWRHRANLQRLYQGTEPKIGSKSQQ